MTTETQIQALSTSAQTHHHSHHQLVFGLRGRAEFELEGPGGHEVNPWVGCLVPSEYSHAFQGVGDNRMLIVNVEPSSPAVSLLHPQLFDQLFDHPRYVDLDMDFVRLLRMVGGEVTRAPDDDWLAGHLIGTLLHALFHRIEDVSARRLPEAAFGRIHLPRLESWIHQHLSESIRVADLADLCCLSVSQFQDAFRRKTGHSPYQFVLKTRLDVAAWLLRNTRQPVADIALQVGFANQSALTRAMQRERRIAPTALRDEPGKPVC